MGLFSFDTKARPGVLRMTLRGRFTADEMRRFVEEHNDNVASFKGGDYRVFCDMRELAPLSPECTALLEEAKAFSASQPNFRGSAVLVESELIAMQVRRTSASSGVLPTEIISHEESACWRFLESVARLPGEFVRRG
jgi:hypothetical protein